MRPVEGQCPRLRSDQQVDSRRGAWQAPARLPWIHLQAQVGVATLEVRMQGLRGQLEGRWWLDALLQLSTHGQLRKHHRPGAGELRGPAATPVLMKGGAGGSRADVSPQLQLR